MSHKRQVKRMRQKCGKMVMKVEKTQLEDDSESPAQVSDPYDVDIKVGDLAGFKFGTTLMYYFRLASLFPTRSIKEYSHSSDALTCHALRNVTIRDRK